MKRKKNLAIILVMLLCMSMLLTGCGVVDTLTSLAEGAAEAIKGGSSNHNRDDDEDDEDDDDDDDDDDDKRHGNGNGHGGAQLAYVPYEEQYELLVSMKDRWYLEDGRNSSRYFVSYGVTDLDDNGRIEIIQSLYNYYTYENDFLVFEVNANCDGLNEVDFVYDGKSNPDITDIYYAYITDDGIFYTSYSYQSGTDVYYLEYYIISMEDCVINAELLKYCEMDVDTYDYVYFDKDGNEISEDEFYDIDEFSYLDYNDYVARKVDMQYPEDIAYPNDEPTDTDLYYFLEHGYTVFMNNDLAYGSYDGELTIYTDPSSADYQALEDVVLLNEGAEGVPVRFKASADANFGLTEGVWNEVLEVLNCDYYYEDIYYNRVYELNLNLEEENNQAIIYGYTQMLVNENNFGKHRGTYTIKVGSYHEGDITEDSRYVKALGIVAYEVYKAGSESEFMSDEDLYYETMAEVISYLYDIQDEEKAIAYRYYDMIEEAFFSWNWQRYYYNDYNDNYIIEYHYGDDGCEIDIDAYIKEYSYYGGIDHYLVTQTDYSEAFEAYSSVEIHRDSKGVPYMIDFTFAGSRGSSTVISFDIEGESSCAFSTKADYIGYY